MKYNICINTLLNKWIGTCYCRNKNKNGILYESEKTQKRKRWRQQLTYGYVVIEHHETGNQQIEELTIDENLVKEQEQVEKPHTIKVFDMT